MGFIYSSLNRSAGESTAQFDNRISRMLPFVTGKAYFDLRNYDAQTGEFGAYIEWDDELVDVLGYQLPAGGYFVKATTPQAYRFHRRDSGLPVYTKLIAQNGRLYPYRTYVMMNGRPFSVEFGGGVLIPFEDRYEELGCEAAGQAAAAGSQRVQVGSQGGSGYLTGSQYRMFGSQRMMMGSQRFRWNGSQMRLLFGSQGGFRYLTGSQYRMFGSQRMLFGSQRFRWNGSQMRMLFGSQGGFRYLTGSQYRMFGSQRMMMGSQRFRWNGSQMRLLFGSQGGFRYLTGNQYRMLGSQYRMFGSQRMLTGSQRVNRSMIAENTIHTDMHQLQDRADSVRASQELMVEFPQEWQLINRSRRPASRIGGNAKFGYGLDLI